jgi:hypothetical protein
MIRRSRGEAARLKVPSWAFRPASPPNTLMSIRSRSSPTTTRAGDAPFQPLAALHPVPTWEDTKLLLVHALGHVRDLIPRSIRVIANGPLAPFVQYYAGRRAERPAQPRVASSGSTDRSADVIRHNIVSGEGLSRRKVAARRRLIEHIDDILRRPQPIGTSRP